MAAPPPTPAAVSSNGTAVTRQATPTFRQPAEFAGPRAQRTIARILDATRDVFLTRGYAGTTIDEIARIARVSRASFYTYFPSKREVLLAVGDHAADDSAAAVERLDGRAASRANLTAWTAEYFDLLDTHGSFAFAWTQAAQEDEDIRVAGMKRHLGICRRFGVLLAAGAGRSADDPTTLGLVAMSALERGWNYSHLYADAVDRGATVAQIAEAMWSMARQPSPAAGPRA